MLLIFKFKDTNPLRSQLKTTTVNLTFIFFELENPKDKLWGWGFAYCKSINTFKALLLQQSLM